MKEIKLMLITKFDSGDCESAIFIDGDPITLREVELALSKAHHQVKEILRIDSAMGEVQFNIRVNPEWSDWINRMREKIRTEKSEELSSKKSMKKKIIRKRKQAL